MKLTIDNQSKIPDYDVLRIVGDLMRDDYKFMTKNRKIGSYFLYYKGGFDVSVPPRTKSGDWKFLVRDRIGREEQMIDKKLIPIGIIENDPDTLREILGEEEASALIAEREAEKLKKADPQYGVNKAKGIDQ